MLQYRGKNAKSNTFEVPERKGESLCSILGCCPGVDLQCYGCHQGLLDMGIPCDQQPISTHSPQRRDCFCDTSCILFEDCCDDHFGACSELYNVSISWKILTETLILFDHPKNGHKLINYCWKWFNFFQKPDSCFRPEDTIDSNSKSSCRLRGSCCSGGDLACYGCNPVLLSRGIPCEQQTTDRQKTHARDCFCDKSCILFQAMISNRKLVSFFRMNSILNQKTKTVAMITKTFVLSYTVQKKF